MDRLLSFGEYKPKSRISFYIYKITSVKFAFCSRALLCIEVRSGSAVKSAVRIEDALRDAAWATDLRMPYVEAADNTWEHRLQYKPIGDKKKLAASNLHQSSCRTWRLPKSAAGFVPTPRGGAYSEKTNVQKCGFWLHSSRWSLEFDVELYSTVKSAVRIEDALRYPT